MAAGKTKATARVSYKVIGPDGKVKHEGTSERDVEFKQAEDLPTKPETKPE